MPSTITITCPECDKLLKVPSQAEGKKVRCSACDAMFIARAGDDDDDSGRPPAKAKASKPAKPAKPEKAKPAAAKPPDDEFTSDTTAFGMKEEYIGRRCPECANAIGDEDRICLSCGYDTLSRTRARTRKVQHITGFDITLWLIPGILSAIVVLTILGGLTWMWLKVDRAMFGEVWYDFLGSLGMKVYASVMGLGISYKLGRFAIKRLILQPKPPEIELKLEAPKR